MKKIIFAIVPVLLVLFILTAAADDYNKFYFVPEDISCEVGENVTVWIMINTSYDDVTGGQTSIIYDPNVVSIPHIEKGNNPDWYMWDYCLYDYETDLEYVMIGASDVMGTFGPGEIALANLTLHGEGSGEIVLHFADESEVGPNHKTLVCGQGGVYPHTTQNGTFTCTGPADTFDKTLVTGWNLVSLPLTPSDNSLTTVLSSIDGNYDAVESYNAATNAFEDATTMDPGTGYFIHMTAQDTWSYEGEAFNSLSELLTTGLNCVGWENTNASLPDALSSIDYRYVSRWNADNQEYEVYDVNAPTDFNDFDMMERGEGYFIAATADCPLDP